MEKQICLGLVVGLMLCACGVDEAPRAPVAHSFPVAAVASLNVMTDATPRPLPRALEAPPAQQAQADLDLPFIPPQDNGAPSSGGDAPQTQPDQSPLPMTVGELVSQRLCSTALTAPLSAQLAAQMNCIEPGTFSPITDIPGVRLGQAANPFMQTEAAEALRRVSGHHPDAVFHVNSSWRSIVQQHILKSWEGRCGIRVAADPGTSHHESGLAIDVPSEVTREFRKALKDEGWSWYCDETNGGRWRNCRDVPHHTYRRGKDIRALSVRAFQMLWNKAHPEDPLPTAGDYGPMTRDRINRTPLTGFPTGTTCGNDALSALDAGNLTLASNRAEAPAPMIPAPERYLIDHFLIEPASMLLAHVVLPDAAASPDL